MYTDPHEEQDLVDEKDTKTRYVTYKGREFIFTCSDPYGFWKIQPKNGPAPDKLSGTYTTFWDAERAVEAYMNAVTFKEAEQDKKRTAKKEALLNDNAP